MDQAELMDECIRSLHDKRDGGSNKRYRLSKKDMLSPDELTELAARMMEVSRA
jgi:hypothetical protein